MHRVEALKAQLLAGAASAVHVAEEPTAWVLQNVDALPQLEASVQSLAGRTLFITGASRGIGLAIALRAARDGANIVIAAKTTEAQVGGATPAGGGRTREA